MHSITHTRTLYSFYQDYLSTKGRPIDGNKMHNQIAIFFLKLGILIAKITCRPVDSLCEAIVMVNSAGYVFAATKNLILVYLERNLHNMHKITHIIFWNYLCCTVKKLCLVDQAVVKLMSCVDDMFRERCEDIRSGCGMGGLDYVGNRYGPWSLLLLQWSLLRRRVPHSGMPPQVFADKYRWTILPHPLNLPYLVVCPRLSTWAGVNVTPVDETRLDPAVPNRSYVF